MGARWRRASPAAGLAIVAALAGCSAGGRYQAEYTVPLRDATAAERAMTFGEAEVECVVQPDRTLGRCRVVRATPDTPEVRDAALQGAHMHGVRDGPAGVGPGVVIRRRVVVGGY